MGDAEMPGRAVAVQNGADLRDRVAQLGRDLGLDAETEVRVGRRIWGAQRHIDVVLRDANTRFSLGIECKYQGAKGSAEEKIAATLEDINAWPIKGIVVFAGDGFSANMTAYLHSTGKAVDLRDVRKWIELYFGL
ncbi:MAG: PD-(D/E)XK nuclease superfamily protein [Gammaproteobacteria bacterium]